MLKLVPLAVLLAALPLRADDTPAEKPDLAKLITVKKGAIPVIVSAPHGGRLPVPGVPLRTGNGAEKFVVVNDTNTDLLAEKFAAELKKAMGGEPYLVIARFERKYVDANRPKEGAYESEAAKPVYDAYHAALKEACETVRKDWGRGLLLDLHGQAAEKDTIFRGTNNFKSVKDLETRFGRKAVVGPNSILGAMEKAGYKTFPPTAQGEDAEDKRFGGGFITSHYGSSSGTGIDAMQLETGGDHRAKAKLDKTAADLADAVKAFAKEYLPAERQPSR